MVKLKVSELKTSPIHSLNSRLNKVGSNFYLDSPFALFFPGAVLYRPEWLKSCISEISLIPRFLCIAFLFVFPQTLPALISTLKPTNCKVRGCIQFHISTLSSFDVFLPVSPLVIKLVTSKWVSPSVLRGGINPSSLRMALTRREWW